MKHYSEAAVERMMKVQEVIMRALAKKIRWYEAAEILGISVRQMRRRKDRWDRQGYDGLFDRRLGKPSPQRVPVSTVEEVLRLYQEQYYDFNVKHFHEQLKREHQLKLSYTWVKTALQTAGLAPRRGRRSKHRKRREPRPLPGMMLHIDGSKHQWFKDGCYYDLIVVLDDATNEIYYAQLVEAESTLTVMAAVRAVIEAKGLFCSLYCDRASHFFLTPKAGERVSDKHITQVGRALAELSIRLIPAYSPEARGRSERSFAPGKDVYHKSCGGVGWLLCRRPMSSCGSTTWPSSTVSLRAQQKSRVRRSLVAAARTSTLSLRCYTSAPWRATTRSVTGTGCCSWKRQSGASH